MMKADLRLVITVASDLAYLRQEWDQSVDDSHLRRNSTVLRRILVNGDFGRAWRAVGFEREPDINAIDLLKHIEGFDLSEIKFALAGGALFKGSKFACILLYLSDAAEARRRDTQPTERGFHLSEFLNSASFITDGEIVTRREVIQYVANKLGGAHLDADIEPPLKSLGGVEIFGKPAVYFELLAIGQAVAHSIDTDRFLQKAHEFVKRPV